MILIIKSTHSLSILLTDRSSGWWATPWVTIHLHSHTLSEWSEHNSYTVMTMNTIDSKEKDSWWNTLRILQINSLNHYSQHSEVISILHLSLFHLSHSSIPYSLLLWRTDCYSFQSIRISVLLTLFIVIISMTVRYHHTVSLSTHQSIHMDTKQCMITIR